MAVVGVAEVQVKPQTGSFGAQVEAAVKAQLSGLTADIDLRINSGSLRSQVESAIEAATAGAGASIELHIDSLGLPAEVERAAEIASAEAEIHFGTEVDSATLGAKVEAAARIAGAGAEVKVNIDGDIGPLERKLERVKFQVGKLDVNRVRSEIESAMRSIGRITQEINVKPHIDPGSADSDNIKKIANLAGVNFADNVLRVAFQTIRNAGLAELATVAASALTSLGGAAISAASSLGTLAGAAAAVPALLGSIAQAAGVAGLSLFGIGGALKAYTAAQKAAGAAAVGGGSSAESAAKAQRNAAKAVERATRDVADAERAAGDAAEQSARRLEDAAQRVIDSQAEMADSVESAQRRLADAQRNLADAQDEVAVSAEHNAERVADADRRLVRVQREELDAQNDLTRARQDAADDLVNLRLEVERLSRAEEDARAKLEQAKRKQARVDRLISIDLTGLSGDQLRAQEKLAEAQDQAAAGDPREQAARDVADAELSLREVLEKQAKAQRDLNDAQAKGVEGSDRVVAATQKLTDAQLSAADAARALTEAQKESARDAEDSQRRVSDALRDTDDAAKELAKTQIDGARQVADAQRDLADTEKDAARSREDSARRISDAQDRLADAIESAADAGVSASSAGVGAANRFQAALDLLAPSQRRFAEFLIELQPKFKEIQEVAAAGLLPGLEEAIRKVLPLMDDLSPIVDLTAHKMADLANRTADLVSSPAFRSDLVRIGRGNVDILESLGSAAISGIDGLVNLTVAAQPLAQHFADLTAKAADYIDKSLEVASNNGKLAGFFQRLQDRIDGVLITVGFLGKGLANIFSEAKPSGDGYLDLLERLAARFEILTERAKESGALAEFFESTKAPLDAVGHLVGDLVEGLAKVGSSNMAGFTAFVESLDQKLLPAVLAVVDNLDEGFLDSLVNLAVAAANFFDAFLTSSPVFTVVVQTLTNLVDAVVFLGTEIPIVSPLLVGLVTVLGTLGTAVAAVKLGSLVSELTGSKAAISAVESAVGRMRGELVQVDAEGKVVQRVGALTRGFELLGKAAVIGAVILVVKTALESLAPSFDKAVTAISSSQEPLDELERQIERLNNPGFWDRLGLAAKEFFADPLGEVFDALRGKGVDPLNASFETLFRETASKSLSTATQVIKDLKDQGKATGNLQKILDDLIDKKARHGITEEEVSRKIQAATDAIKKNSDSLEDNARQARENADQLLELSNAEIGTEAAYDRFTQALIENGDTFDSNTEQGRNNLSARNDLLGAIQREVDEMGKAAAAGQLDTERKDELIGRLRVLEQSSYPGVAAQAKVYLDQLLAIPPDANTKLNLDSEEAQARLDRFLASLNALPANVKLGLNILGIPTDIQQRAIGGPVKRNRAYIVGEHRAELFVPEENGRIIPEVPPIRRQVTDSIAAMVEGLDLTARIRIVPEQAGSTTANVSAVANDDVSAIVRALSDLERDLRRGLATNETSVRVSSGLPGANGTAVASVGGLNVQGLTIQGMPVNITLPPGFPVTDPAALRDFIMARIMEVLAQIADRADLGLVGLGVG